MDLMTKEKLMDLLHYPDNTGQAVDMLYSMLEEYPYFHTGYQLYIKGLQQTNQAEMERQLGIAAISVRDRSMLYDYLNNPDIFRQRNLPVEYQTKRKAIAIEPIAEKKAKSESIAVVDPEAEKRAKEKKKILHNALIDSFLISNPKIVPGESSYVVDISESMQDVTDIGTETLADIYATQGNKDKAIEIYEQLILQYPEKNIYFAAQIKRLKD